MVDSATPTNEPGSSSPQIGCCQRTSASAATIDRSIVDLGLVVQHDAPLSTPPCRFNSTSLRNVALQRHVVGGHRDLVAATAFGRQHRLVGAAQQVGVLSRPGMPTATPMLTVRVIVWPPIADRSAPCSEVRANVSAASA